MKTERLVRENSAASRAANSLAAPSPAAATRTTRLSAEQEQQLAELLDAYLAEVEIGLPPDPEQMIARYPDLADALRDHLKSLEMLQFAAHGFGATKTKPPAPLTGERRLGEYDIVREIGRGGMGIVYEARQASLQRKVALKVLPFAAVLDQKQIVRFNNEARAAAQLHHPHIVPVYAVGCERGVHYYAMQFIEGQPLDQAIRELREQHGVEAPAYEDNTTRDGQIPVPDAPARSTVRGLSTAESIRSRSYFQSIAELGIQAAEALQHAHEYGIVHRDIKPSNLLLDETGKVWVTDFGLARCQSETSLTAAGDVLGTVRYMSPEQAAGRPVDERTDIYSLGVTLYELLTLRSAFEAPNRAQFVKQIELDEPPAPRRWNPAIPVDLETIVLKAIAKAKDQRYSAASELADDLKSFLASKTIRARRPSWSDRAAKWATRHRTVVSAASVMLLVLLFGSLASLMLISQSRTATQRALQQSQVNLQQADEQRELATFHYRQAREMLDRLGAEHAERLSQIPGAEPLRQNLLRETLNYYEQFLTKAVTAPADAASPLAADAASTQFKAATLYEQLGETDQALIAYRSALQRFELLSKDDAAQQRHLALCHNNLGLLLDRLGQTDAAEKHLRTALALHGRADQDAARSKARQTAEDAAPSSNFADAAKRTSGDLAQTWNNLGLLLSRTDRRPEAANCFDRAVALLESLTKELPHDVNAAIELATTYNNLAVFHSNADLAKAEQFGRRAIALLEQVEPSQPKTPRRAAELAASYSNLGAVLRRANQISAAADCYGHAIRLQQKLAQGSPAVVKYQVDLAVMLNNLGLVQEQQKKIEDAISAYAEAVRLQQAAAAAAPQIAMIRDFLESHQHNLDRAQRTAAESTKSTP